MDYYLCSFIEGVTKGFHGFVKNYIHLWLFHIND